MSKLKITDIEETNKSRVERVEKEINKICDELDKWSKNTRVDIDTDLFYPIAKTIVLYYEKKR